MNHQLIQIINFELFYYDVFKMGNQIEGYQNKVIKITENIQSQQLQIIHTKIDSCSFDELQSFLSAHPQLPFDQMIIQGNQFTVQVNKNFATVNLEKIKKISLYYNSLTFEHVKSLSSNQSLINLEQLFLNRNFIGSNGVKYLATGFFVNLKLLDLASNSIGSEGMKHLSVGSFIKLQHLILQHNGIGGQGMRYFTHGHFESVDKLYLYGNSIGTEGTKHLINSRFTSMKWINLQYNNIFKELEFFLTKKRKILNTKNKEIVRILIS